MPEVFTLKQIVPSLEVEGKTVTMSTDDFRRLAEQVAAQISVDEEWYLSQNEDVAASVARGDLPSGAAHFRIAGFFEGRMPSVPVVNENWYLKIYPDVAAGVKAGTCKSAADHFRSVGMNERRLPQPPEHGKWAEDQRW